MVFLYLYFATDILTVIKAINNNDFNNLNDLYQRSSSNLLIICGFFFLLINLNIVSFYKLMNNEFYSDAILVVLIISIALKL